MTEDILTKWNETVEDGSCICSEYFFPIAHDRKLKSGLKSMYLCVMRRLYFLFYFLVLATLSSQPGIEPVPPVVMEGVESEPLTTREPPALRSLKESDRDGISPPPSTQTPETKEKLDKIGTTAGF